MEVQKLLDISALQKEMDTLKLEKQQEYAKYQEVRTQARELETIKRNVDSLLSAPQKSEKKKEREEI